MYERYQVDKTEPLSDVVKIEIIEQGVSSEKYGNIFLPGKELTNAQVIKGVVKEVGPKAAKAGIKAGDKVLYDKDAAYYHPPTKPGTIIMVNEVNVICKVIKEDKHGIQEIQPYGSQIFIGEYGSVEDEIGGIILADNAKERSNIVEVISLGTGVPLDNGKMSKFDVKAGDRIVIDTEGGTKLKMGTTLKGKVIHTKRILAIVKPDKKKKK